MSRYPSNITFLYYDDLSYGHHFLAEVLGLDLVMDQEFAAVYQISTTSYLGIVNRTTNTDGPGDTLISLNTDNVRHMHTVFRSLPVTNLTAVQHLDSIPLDSFFFSDNEGHRFEIQEFLLGKDRARFLHRGEDT